MSSSARIAFLTALLALAAARSGAALEQTPSDLLRNLERVEGTSVTVRGSVRDLRTTVTRKGARYYTFYLSDKHASVLVLTTARPTCPVDAIAVVEGRVTLVKLAVHQPIGRVEATRVVCEVDPATRSRPGREP